MEKKNRLTESQERDEEDWRQMRLLLFFTLTVFLIKCALSENEGNQSDPKSNRSQNPIVSAQTLQKENSGIPPLIKNTQTTQVPSTE